VRFGGDAPKQLISIAGKPLLAWTLERLLGCGLTGLIVALPEEWLASTADVFPEHERVSWVAGGATRQLSVAACLATCPADADLVLVHDGARPAVAVSDLLATLDAAEQGDGAILGRPIADTLKRVADGQVSKTVDRTGFFRAETPQVFRPEVLAAALRQSAADGFTGTDEASIVERLPGVSILAVAASWPNPKLTRPQDLPLVRILLEEKGES